MAEKSITCDTFDRLELPPGPAIRIALDVDSGSGIAVMESCRHCKDFFGRYASPVCIDKVQSHLNSVPDMFVDPCAAISRHGQR